MTKEPKKSKRLKTFLIKWGIFVLFIFIIGAYGEDLVDYYGFWFRGGEKSYIGYQTLVGDWNVTGNLNVLGGLIYDPGEGVHVGGGTETIAMDGDDLYVTDHTEIGDSLKVGTTIEATQFINASEMFKGTSAINSTAELDTIYVSRDTWTDIDSYPSACTGNNLVQGLADTLTCTLPNINGTTVNLISINTSVLTAENITTNFLTATETVTVNLTATDIFTTNINATELFKGTSPLNSTTELSTQFVNLTGDTMTGSLNATNIISQNNITTPYKHEYWNGTCWMTEINGSLAMVQCP